MNVQIPSFILSVFERGTSRKFGVVVGVLYMGITGAIPTDRLDFVLLMTIAYVMCEAFVDVFGKKPKKDEEAK